MENIQTSYEKLFSEAKAHGQQHLFQFWPELSAGQKEQLLAQVSEFDFSRLDGLIAKNVIQAAPFPMPKKIEPAWFYPADPKDDKQRYEYNRAWEVGENALRAGKVCAFTVAGGAGTRLGFDGPKGMYKISPIFNKPLFQLFAEYILNCKKRYNPDIRWYLMTSTTNHEATIRFFQENSFFGLNPGHVVFFQQGMMPAFSNDGKILLDSKDSISLSPDGHGGSLRALRKSGALDEMKKLGIEYISYFQVDNPLVRCLDPLFIGLHIQCGSEMSSKSLAKAHDLEKVGNFVIGDDKMMVIEYSDLPDEYAHAKNADGSRKFDAGSIAIHILSRKFIERITEGDLKLPWHRAVKKVPFVDEKGNKIKPETPNAVKLEQFVFDAIPMAENSIVFQTKREEEFSPVKNAEGSDSPATCRRDLSSRAARWLEKAGVAVEKNAEGFAACNIDLSPLRAIFPEDLSK
jgi:UDP-N-acetylglucosamine/UDP-N-acetylgalactosamine diphosphorylase